MAITFRNTKKAPLTHIEMDHNFGTLYISSSVTGNTINLYSLGTGSLLPITHSIAVETGSYSAGLGLDEVNSIFSIQNAEGLTSNTLLKWDDTLGQLTDSIITDNGLIATVAGDMVVTGKITAQEFHSELTSASIVYQSGSTQFGNDIGDTHNFIGVLDARTPGNKISVTFDNLASLPDPSVFDGMIAHAHAEGALYYSDNGGWVQLANQNQTGDFLLNTTDTFNGTLTLIGSQHLTGSFVASGSSRFIESWPLLNNDNHFISLADFILDGKEYSHSAFAIENWDTPAEDYRNSFSFEIFDSSNYNYGAEIHVSPTDAHLLVVASGSGTPGEILVRRVTGGAGNETTQAKVYADEIHIGRPSAHVSITGSSIIVDSDLTVTGKVVAQEYHTEFISSSIIYDSGSTQFGDDISDTHTFTGRILAPTHGNQISFAFDSIASLPDPSTFDGMLAHPHLEGGFYYSDNGQWLALSTAASSTVTIEGQNINVNGSYPNFQLTGSTDTTYSAGTGLSLVGTTFNNTAPDQTVSLTQGGATAITGTYPNFTISSTDTTYTNVSEFINDVGYITSSEGTTYSAGTGLSLVGTTFNNTAPDQTITIEGQNINVNGSYPNFQLTGSLTDITSLNSKSGSWDTAVTWGDHSLVGYLTSSVETDPIFEASPAADITLTNITNWNTAYGWGDHSLVGYLTSSVETDTLASVVARGSTTPNSITAANFITTSDKRLKSDIEPLKDGLDTIKKFVSYEYTKDGVQDAGFLAQEVQEAIPYAIAEGEDGFLTMRDRPVLAYMHKAILELEARLAAIEKKLQ